jgi:cell division protein FtsX
MELPNLPTDNFYKFFTVGGLAMALTAIYFQVSLFQPYSDSVVTQLEASRAYSRKLDAHLADMRANEVQHTINGISKTDRLKLDAENKRLIEQLRTLASEQNPANDLKHTANIRVAEKRFYEWEMALRCAYGGGALLLLTGLGGWYFRHQRFQDELLRVELNQKQRAGSSDRFRVRRRNS